MRSTAGNDARYETMPPPAYLIAATRVKPTVAPRSLRRWNWTHATSRPASAR
jgi:hypothetical protein